MKFARTSVLLAVTTITACDDAPSFEEVDTPVVRYCFRVGVDGEDAMGETVFIEGPSGSPEGCVCASIADFGEHDVRGDVLLRWRQQCIELASGLGLTDQQCYEKAAQDRFRDSLVDEGDCDGSDYSR